MLGLTTNNDPRTSGIKDIAEAIGGGFKEGSLVFIVGETRTGKSVLCQHIAHAILNTKGSAVAYYSSEYNTDGLTSQMISMSLDTREHLEDEHLKVFKIYSKAVVREASKSLKLIITHIQRIPPHFKLIIIDSPSIYLSRVNPMIKMDFLQSCKQLCDKGHTIVMAIDSSAIDKKIAFRAFAMSDYYLKLRTDDPILDRGKIDTRIIKILEVSKLSGVERYGQSGLKFEIKPHVGIQILPFIHIRV